MQDIDSAPGGRPCLGIIINLPKCEVFSRHGLDMFPLNIKKSDKPNMEILGIPIGEQDFCSSFISKKHSKAKILLSQLEEVGVVDPQVALILLRLCGSICKLVHLARATPSTLTCKAFALIDDDIRMSFCRCIGVDTSDTAWQQAQLSPSRGGPWVSVIISPLISSIHLLFMLIWLWYAFISPPVSSSRDL